MTRRLPVPDLYDLKSYRQVSRTEIFDNISDGPVKRSRSKSLDSSEDD
jgi:hypothetical protein